MRNYAVLATSVIMIGATIGCSGSGAGRDVDGTPASGGSSSSGGGTAIGSSGGSAGGAPTTAGVDCTQDDAIELELLADFEDATTNLIEHPDRHGSFYASNDGSVGSAMEPPAGAPIPATEIVGDRCGSVFALNIAGSGFTSWGANFAADLAYGLTEAETATKGSFDASAFTGIAFWARIEAGSTPGIRVGVRDTYSDPDGGVCVHDDESPDRCYDAFGRIVDLTSKWQFYTVPFVQMTQQGWGYAAPAIDTANLYAITFQYGAGQDFDVWIDDLTFYK